jgi:hypothetical protein
MSSATQPGLPARREMGDNPRSLDHAISTSPSGQSNLFINIVAADPKHGSRVQQP